MSAAALAMMNNPEMMEAIREQQRRINIAWMVLGGVALAGVGYLVVRKAIRVHKDKKESRKGFDMSEAASFAKRINQAFWNDNWFGTNEVKLRKVLTDIPTWEFWLAVSKSYEDQFQSVLADDLEDELDTTEFDEMMEIVNRLKVPKSNLNEHVRSWNERLRNAWDVSCWLFPCTDEDAAYSVLKDIKKMPDPFAALSRLEDYYHDENGISLQDEAESEMEGSDLDTWNFHRNKILNSRVA